MSKKTAEDTAKERLKDWIHRRLSGPPPVELSPEKVNVFMVNLRDQLKDTKITEGTQFNVRFEMFNVFNHANFLSSSVVGNAGSGQFGQATNTAPGRIGQISGKLTF